MDLQDSVPMMDDGPEAGPSPADKLQGIAIRLTKMALADNAAEFLGDDERSAIGELVCREYKLDRDSRSDWETTARRAMDMARQVKTTKTTPWEGASNVKYPMLTVAALQFAARAYPAIVQGPRVVKCSVVGADPMGMKAASADRVAQHMSYQLVKEMPEWEEDTDTLLHQIPIVGCAFRKVYYDPMSAAGCASELVSAFDLVVNHKAKSLETVPRVTHVFPLYPHEIQERQRSGRFLDVPLDASDDEGRGDSAAPHMFLEQHRWWDSDGDGFAEPWIVTVHEATQKVVRVVANYDVESIVADPRKGRIVKISKRTDVGFVKIPFVPDPEGGFYDIGFGKLLEAISDVVDTTINQMMDAGSLANAGGGFIGSGLTLGKNRIQMRPGLWHNVQASGPDLKSAIVPMQHPGPNAVLFQLLGLMIEAGKDIAAVKDILTGDTGKTMTATATMALIEQGLKVFTAIFKRIFRAMAREFRLVYECNKRHFDSVKYVALLDEPVEVTQLDYMGDFDILPEADPNTVTDMQRLSRAQFLLEQVEKGNPHIDSLAATKRALEAVRIERVEEVLKPPPEGPSPVEELEMAGAQAEVDKTKAEAVKTAAEAEALVVQNEMNALMLPGIQFDAQMPAAMPEMMPEQMPMDPMAGLADALPMGPIEQPMDYGPADGVPLQ